MSVRNPLPQAELEARFTHHARYMGLPCYFNVDTGDLHDANGVPAFLLDWAIALEGFLDWGACLVNPQHMPHFRLCLVASIAARG